MTRSMRRRLSRAGLLATLATLVTGVAVVSGPPAGAATKNPCKVLKKVEVQQVFGGTVSSGKQGVATAVSAQCEFQLSANGERPSGAVDVHVVTKRATAAYDGLKKSKQYVALAGVPNALYGEKVHAVYALEGDVLLGVQGGFVITDPLPIHFYDDETQLTDLARIGAERV